MIKEHYFFSQPHQPFFVLSFVNAIVFMLIFMLSFKGIITLSITPIIFHAYSFVYAFFTPAFLAFLLTTFPRFLSQETVKKSVYMKLFGLFVLGNTTFLIGSFISVLIYKIGMVITLIAFTMAIKVLYDIHKSSDMPNKHDTFWMLIGFFAGIAAHALFILGEFNELAIEISIYTYLFIVGFSVAQRMIPFFSHCMVDKNKPFLRNVVILLGIHVVLEMIYLNLSFIVDAVLALYIAKELHRWKLPFPNTNPMLSILHVSLFWVPIAFALAALSNACSFFFASYFLALDIHVLMLGFLFTVLIGFGTRVTIGHSGNQMHANRLTVFLFIWTQVVVIVRLITSFTAEMNWNYMILFDISVTVWLIMFIVWAIQFFKVLIFGTKLT
ncbi:MAG: NnrS family protein [Campylobacterota bacterium]|nr:NnrS family protein [Campylobacterota bacterium]